MVLSSFKKWGLLCLVLHSTQGGNNDINNMLQVRTKFLNGGPARNSVFAVGSLGETVTIKWETEEDLIIAWESRAWRDRLPVLTTLTKNMVFFSNLYRLSMFVICKVLPPFLSTMEEAKVGALKQTRNAHEYTVASWAYDVPISLCHWRCMTPTWLWDMRWAPSRRGWQMVQRAATSSMTAGNCTVCRNI